MPVSGMYGRTIPVTSYAHEGKTALVGAATKSMSALKTQSQHFMSMVQDILPTDLTQQILVGVGVVGIAGVGGAIGYKLLQAPEEPESEQVKIPELEPILVIRQGPRGRTVPSIAPWSLKIETFLRAYGVEHEVTFDFNFEANRMLGPGSRPCLILDLEDMSDHHGAIKFLCERYNLDPKRNLSKKEQLLGNAFSHLVDHHLYWGLALWRWVYDQGRSLPEIQNLNAISRAAMPSISRSVEKMAWFHGIGKQCPRVVMQDIIKDLRSLSMLLGGKKYFFNDIAPTELDCSIFGILAQMMWTMPSSPYHVTVTETYPNLAYFCENIRFEFWKDWGTCLSAAPFVLRPFRSVPRIPLGLEKSLNVLHQKIEKEFDMIQATLERDLNSLHDVRCRNVECQKQVLDDTFEHNTKVLNEFLNRDRPAMDNEPDFAAKPEE